MTTTERGTPVVPLGPDSLTWRLFGDWRALMQALWAGSMQNMHPQLGAAVEYHSLFFEERWQRLLRSLYPIGGGVFDGDRAPATAREVRDYHRGIHGVDPAGRRYNALEPGVFFWAHATFVMGMVVTARTLGDPLSEPDLERLWVEARQWWALYGMPDPPDGIPPTWAAFQRYWDHMCEHVLEDNKATRDVLDLRTLPRPPFLPVPGLLWRVLRVPVAGFLTWLTVGMWDEPVRRRLGYRWTRRDAVLLEALRRTVSTLWRLVPPDRRMHPRARDGWRRARGRVAPDAPLVETPDRNLPPPHRRDSPHHYSPRPRS